jgi:hypothetical protein
MEEERELFLSQVLSDMTTGEFRQRGVVPGEAWERVRRLEDDIVDLFNSLPYGENTPGVFLRNMGGKVFRMEATGLGRRGLRLVAMDMVMEGGNWKLRWFVPAAGFDMNNPTPQARPQGTPSDDQRGPAVMPDVPVNR